ncbi:MAG: hypothetical protein P9M14_18260 [Candidatus Alcyoniella australis]|nr:hypothetical protein [Candidatus Alcyoniella australis]
MDDRVIFKVVNKTGSTITCTDVHCESFDNLSTGKQLTNGQTGTFTSSTNDRIFAIWEMDVGDGGWAMGMTCPKNSHNSAYGTPKAGLQTYSRTGTPVTFTYHLGTPNMADWDDGDTYNVTKGLRYGDCS